MGDQVEFIPSKASALKKADVNFESVVYESYKPRLRKTTFTEEKSSENGNNEKELNVKQVKNEIIKLSMSGLDTEEKEKAKINLLIKLGAKPPKNKNKNYKQLQIERKQSKEQETKRLNFLQLGKNTRGKSTAKGKSFDRKRRKTKGDILSIYGQVKATIKN